MAYALLADGRGVLLFHTNPARRGGRLPAEAARAAAAEPGHDAGRRVELGTGRPAYELTRVLRAADGSRRLLRVVIYTAGADRFLERGRGLWLSVAAVLGLLWGSGVLLWRLAARTERLEGRMRRQRELPPHGKITVMLVDEIRNALGGSGDAQWLDEKTAAGDPRKPGLGWRSSGDRAGRGGSSGSCSFLARGAYAPRDPRRDEVLAAAAASAAGWQGEPRRAPCPPASRSAPTPKDRARVANAVRTPSEAAGAGRPR